MNGSNIKWVSERRIINLLLVNPQSYQYQLRRIKNRIGDNNMGLVELVVVLIVFGLIYWLIQNFLPIPAQIKMIIEVVLVIILILWLLSAVGLIGNINIHS
jgi:cobalamin biosynthesis protein CobD/CbiB